jgi:hypothetical protein
MTVLLAFLGRLIIRPILPDVENASDRRGGKSAIAKISTITVANSCAETRQGDAVCVSRTPEHGSH